MYMSHAIVMSHSRWECWKRFFANFVFAFKRYILLLVGKQFKSWQIGSDQNSKMN